MRARDPVLSQRRSVLEVTPDSWRVGIIEKEFGIHISWSVIPLGCPQSGIDLGPWGRMRQTLCQVCDCLLTCTRRWYPTIWKWRRDHPLASPCDCPPPSPAICSMNRPLPPSSSYLQEWHYIPGVRSTPYPISAPFRHLAGSGYFASSSIAPGTAARCRLNVLFSPPVCVISSSC